MARILTYKNTWQMQRELVYKQYDYERKELVTWVYQHRLLEDIAVAAVATGQKVDQPSATCTGARHSRRAFSLLQYSQHRKSMTIWFPVPAQKFERFQCQMKWIKWINIRIMNGGGIRTLNMNAIAQRGMQVPGPLQSIWIK